MKEVVYCIAPKSAATFVSLGAVWMAGYATNLSHPRRPKLLTQLRQIMAR
jgi:hypothetical protein